MRNRLSRNPAKPRCWISLPGYPTLAAASFYLCLSSGCGSGTSTPEPPRSGGTAPPAFDASAPADTDEVPNPTGKIAVPFDASAPPPDTQPVPNPTGFGPAPFDASAQEDAEAVSPPDLKTPADLAPETTPSQPSLTGGAPIPFDGVDP